MADIKKNLNGQKNMNNKSQGGQMNGSQKAMPKTEKQEKSTMNGRDGKDFSRYFSEDKSKSMQNNGMKKAVCTKCNCTSCTCDSSKSCNCKPCK